MTDVKASNASLGEKGSVVPTLVVSPPLPEDSTTDEQSKDDQKLKVKILKELHTPLTKEEIASCKVDAQDIPGGFAANMILRPRGKKVDTDPAHTPSLTVMMKGFDTHVDDTRTERTDGTERKIRFVEGHLLPLHTHSFLVIRYLLNHPQWGIAWDIDPKDGGGLWKFLGWVMVERVAVNRLAVNTKTIMVKKAS